jgi:uncharacterized protein
MRTIHDFEIIDVHQHTGDASGFAPASKALSPAEDVRVRLANMEKHGIDAAILMPSSMTRDISGSNDHTAACRDLRPDKFPACLGTVDPLAGDAALREMDRCLGELAMQGMVWHHRFNSMIIDHPAMKPLLRRLADAQVPAFIHIIAGSSMETPWRLENIAEEYPEITFVALDGFSSNDQCQWMLRIARAHPNIIFDTGVMSSVGHGITRFVRKAGANRLVLGTDCYSEPHYHTPFPITELLASPLSDEELKQIFSKNAQNLFNL